MSGSAHIAVRCYGTKSAAATRGQPWPFAHNAPAAALGLLTSLTSCGAVFSRVPLQTGPHQPGRAKGLGTHLVRAAQQRPDTARTLQNPPSTETHAVPVKAISNPPKPLVPMLAGMLPGTATENKSVNGARASASEVTAESKRPALLPPRASPLARGPATPCPSGTPSRGPTRARVRGRHQRARGRVSTRVCARRGHARVNGERAQLCERVVICK